MIGAGVGGEEGNGNRKNKTKSQRICPLAAHGKEGGSGYGKGRKKGRKGVKG